jgi:hypothetical protein
LAVDVSILHLTTFTSIKKTTTLNPGTATHTILNKWGEFSNPLSKFMPAPTPPTLEE